MERWRSMAKLIIRDDIFYAKLRLEYNNME